MAIFGDTGPIKMPGAIYRVERNGLATYDVRYKISSGDDSLFEQGRTSEDYSNVVLVSGAIVSIGEANCDEVYLDLHYEGRDNSRTKDEFTSDLTLDITCSVEPIDTHPNFLKIAGTLGAEENGAKFNKDGRFEFFRPKWPVDSDEMNPLAGVRSYNVPVMVASQTRIDTDWPDENEFKLVGKIIDSKTLDNRIPGFSGERNWLYTGMRIRSIGNVYYEVNRNAALSGPRKWVDLIYDPKKSEPDS